MKMNIEKRRNTTLSAAVQTTKTILNGVYQVIPGSKKTDEELAFLGGRGTGQKKGTSFHDLIAAIVWTNRFVAAKRFIAGMPLYEASRSYDQNVTDDQVAAWSKTSRGNASYYLQTSADLVNPSAVSERGVVGASFGTDVVAKYFSEGARSLVLRATGSGYEIHFVHRFEADNNMGNRVTVGLNANNGSLPHYESLLSDMQKTAWNPTTRAYDTRMDEKVEFYRKLSNHKDVSKNASTYVREISSLAGIDYSKTSSLGKRGSFRVPLDFDFSKWFPETTLDIKDYTGATVDAKTIGVHGQVSKEISDVYGKVVELEVTVVPNETYVSHESRLATWQSNNPSREPRVQDRGVLAIPDDMGDAFIALGLEVSILPVIKISKELAVRISQSEPVNVTALYNWVLLWASSVFHRRAGGKTPPALLPTYITPLMHLHVQRQRRKEQGFYVTESRRDDTTKMMANVEGFFRYVPSIDDVTLDAAQEYENVMEAGIELSAQMCEPLNFSRVTVDQVTARDHADKLDKLTELKQRMINLSGFPLAVDWDLNILVHPSTTADHVMCTSLEGGNKQKRMAIPALVVTKSAKDAIHEFVGPYAVKKGFSSPDDYEFGVRTDALSPIIRVMAWLFDRGVFPDVSHWLQAAANELGRQDGVGPDDWENFAGTTYRLGTNLSKYLSHNQLSWVQPGADAPSWSFPKIDDDMFPANRVAPEHTKLVAAYYRFRTIGRIVENIWNSDDYKIERWMNGVGSSLCAQHGWTSPEDTPWYTGDAKNAFKDKQNVCNYVVGRAWSLMLRAALDYIRKPGSDVLCWSKDVSRPFVAGGRFMPNYTSLAHRAMPLAAIMGDLLPHAEEHKRVYHEELAKTREMADAPLPVVPGGDGVALMPHQVRAHETLAHAPEMAVLASAPGGGKTTMEITDICNLMHAGKVRRPLVLCPDNLICNWVDEFNRIAPGAYNTVPITSATTKRFMRDAGSGGIGHEEFVRLLMEAPVNTVFLSTYSFIRYRRATQDYIVVGGDKKPYFPNLEFLKLFGFDLIAIDESHLLKNALGREGGSSQSKAVAYLTQDPRVKYVRLLSGTVVSNVLTDVVGQCRLMDTTVFHNESMFKGEFYDAKGINHAEDAGDRIKRTLQSRTAYLESKRRDWAFILPRCEERIFQATMEPWFKAVHDAILQETLDKLQAEHPDMFELLMKADEEGASEEAQNQAEMIIQNMLLRLTFFMHDPLADGLAQRAFTEEQKATVKPPKVVVIEQRLEEHFADPDAGKVLIFSKFREHGAGAIYKHLDQKWRATALYYDASTKQNLERFKSDPNVKILVCCEDSLNTGHNLQIASRLIRVDTTWTPGEMDQALSRVFRPDVRNKYNRSVVYLDWIVVKDSPEITKMARLIYKILDKVSYDEAGNVNYMNLPVLPVLKMSLENMRLYTNFESVSEYIDAYREYMTIYTKEFEHFRATQKIEFTPLADTPPLTGSGKLPITPFAANQVLPDPENWGITRLSDFITDPENAAFKENPERLVGMYAVTEMGPGRIVSVRAGGKTGSDEDDTDEDTGGEETDPEATGEDASPIEVEPVSVTSIRVKIPGQRRPITYHLPLAHLALNVPESDRALFEEEKLLVPSTAPTPIRERRVRGVPVQEPVNQVKTTPTDDEESGRRSRTEEERQAYLKELGELRRRNRVAEKRGIQVPDGFSVYEYVEKRSATFRNVFPYYQRDVVSVNVEGVTSAYLITGFINGKDTVSHSLEVSMTSVRDASVSISIPTKSSQILGKVVGTTVTPIEKLVLRCELGQKFAFAQKDGVWYLMHVTQDHPVAVTDAVYDELMERSKHLYDQKVETKDGISEEDVSVIEEDTGVIEEDTGEDTGVIEEDTGVIEEDTGVIEEDTGVIEEDTGEDTGAHVPSKGVKHTSMVERMFTDDQYTFKIGPYHVGDRVLIDWGMANGARSEIYLGTVQTTDVLDSTVLFDDGETGKYRNDDSVWIGVADPTAPKHTDRILRRDIGAFVVTGARDAEHEIKRGDVFKLGTLVFEQGETSGSIDQSTYDDLLSMSSSTQRSKRPSKGTPSVELTPPPVADGPTVVGTLSVINGAVALMLNPEDPDVEELTAFESLQYLDRYLWVSVVTKRQFDAVMLWIRQNLRVPSELLTDLDAFRESFRSGAGLSFNIDVATRVDVKNFLRESHHQGVRGETSVFPFVKDGQFFFVINYATNKLAHKVINVRIPNAGPLGKWTLSDPTLYTFVTSKAEATQLVNKLGPRIANKTQLIEDISVLRTHRHQNM